MALETIQNLTIPVLPEGKQYRILLREADFSFTKGILKEVISGGTIPVIVLSDHCICCNKETKDKKITNPFDDDRSLKQPLEVPVCNECSKHALADAGQSAMGVVVTLLGTVGTIAMSVSMVSSQKIYNMAGAVSLLIASLIFLALGVFFMRRHNQKKKLKIPGHCPGTNFHSLCNKELIVETSNRRIIEEILSNNKDVCHINTTADPLPFKIKKT